MTSRCVTLCFILSSLVMVASIPTTARKRHSGHELQPNTFSSPRRAVRDRPGLGLSSHRLSHLSGATTPVSKDAVQNRSMLVLLVGCSALIAAGSIVLLVFASLAHLHIPARNLVAAVALAFASLLLEALVGHPRRTSFVGQTISEVGQALVIAAAGWVCFSLVWANGYGSMLTPGRKPTLNAAAVLGCSAAAAVYGCVRPPSRAQTATPFASALLMLHLHWLITVDLGKDMECLTLAPMAMASGILVLCSLSLDVFVQRARAVAANGPQAPGTGGRVGGYELSYYLQGVRGTEDMVLASLAVNYAWTFLALLKWTFLEAPSWGFVAISAVLSAVQLGTRAAFAAVPAVARAGRGYYIEAVGGYYPQLAYWLALLCAWRTLWPDTPYDTSDGWFKRLPEEVKAERLRRAFRKREKHFFSLVGAYSLWGITSASAGRMMTSCVAVGMVNVVLFKTAVAALFEEPLMMAGIMGLALGAGLIGAVIKFAGEEEY